MNAAEINAIVQHWPREVWPDLEYVPVPHEYPCPNIAWRVASYLDHPVNADLAELAFEARGMRWLKNAEIHELDNGTIWVWIDGKQYVGPSRLAAIDAAIRSAK